MGADRDPRRPRATSRRVHRRYVDVGCDVISHRHLGPRDRAARRRRRRLWETSGPVHWMDVARRGVRLAREAAAEAGRADEVAVAFSINGDVDTPDGQETIRLLARAFEQDPPDLILVETLSLVRSSTYATVEALLDTGLPVWLSFRRCRHGVCGVYGEHWGGPEGDAFGRAARRFEEMGVGALRSTAFRPTTSPACCPGCATSPTCRSASTRTSATCRRPAGATRPASAPRIRRARAALARGGRADHRRLLRRRPRARRRRARRARANQARARPARRRGAATAQDEAPAPHARPAAHWTRLARAARCSRSTSPRSPSSPACSSPPRQPAGLEVPVPRGRSARTSAASTSAAARGCRRSSSRATAPLTCTRSTSTAPRSRTR